MKKHLKQITAAVLSILACIFVISSIVVTGESTKFLKAETEDKIVETAENNANKVSAAFNHMVGLSDALAANVQVEFDLDSYMASPEEYMNSFAEQQGEFIVSSLETSDYAHSLYVVFNTGMTKEPLESWYVANGDRIEQLFSDPNEKIERMNRKNDEAMAYYYKAQKTDEGVWTGMYYDEDIDEDVFSYSRAIYDDGKFIGVAGSDIAANQTKYIVNNLSMYKDGYAVLLNTEFEYIIKPHDIGTKELSSISDRLGSLERKGSLKKSGIVRHSMDDRDYIAGYSTLDNGWIMVITQPEKSAFASVERLRAMLVVLEFILAVVSVAFAIMSILPFAARQSDLEKENREKDALLAYESRKARIGEMIGNVAHQWKQPLNTINIISGNLLDGYRFGDLDEAEMERGSRKIRNITKNMAETISDFTEFMKPSNHDPENFPVRECVRVALSLMEESLAVNRITVNITGEQNAEIFGFEREMTHVLFNILTNARDSIIEKDGEERRIEINIESDARWVWTKITDTGVGMSRAQEDKAFDPYYTTKDENGTGIGLYIARQIIEERMNGRISLSGIKGGACCIIATPSKKH